jgi:hypothetical protein
MKNLLEELVSLAVQYRNDLMFPIKNEDSIERRLAWINDTIEKAKKAKMGEKK